VYIDFNGGVVGSNVVGSSTKNQASLASRILLLPSNKNQMHSPKKTSGWVE